MNETQHSAKRSILLRYLFTTDHKMVGLQFFWLSIAAVVTGVLLSLLMRIHILWPQAKIWLIGEIKPETYLSYLTIHGTLMVFFVLGIAPQWAFGSYFLPLQIGANEMAFPRLSMLSFWTTVMAFFSLIASLFVQAPPTGWTAYPPLSAIAEAGPGLGLGMDLWIVSIALLCVAATLGAINFITTTLHMRTRGMELMRMPLTVWSWFVSAGMSVLAFSVLLVGGLLLFLDRHYGTSFFVPTGLVVNGSVVKHSGGSPLLWQHLFWFFGHPEVYIVILPGMGLVSTVIATFSRRRVFGYTAMAASTVAIGVLGFLVWGHHMFVSGMNPFSGVIFSALTLVIAVPSAIKTVNWLGTMWRGQIRFATPMLFAIGFVSVFVTGGLSGPILAQPSLDSHLHDTYFVVAHFHLIMGVAAIFGIFAATYYWFPKMFGREMNEFWGKTHFWLTFLGAYAIFMPMHFLGMAGHPRRYSQMTELPYLQPLIPLQKHITYSALFTAAVQVIFFANLLWSIRRGKKAEANPWEATTLEWTLASPPPDGNFGNDFPAVQHGPYEFSVPGRERDYTMQHEVVPTSDGQR